MIQSTSQPPVSADTSADTTVTAVPAVHADSAATRMTNAASLETIRDRYRGCLLGGAVGDALGYAIEFLSEEEIRRRYGDSGITRYELRDGRALISDDTQMTLFTAEGLLLTATQGERCEPVPGCSPYTASIRRSYQDWYLTQTRRYPLPDSARYTQLATLAPLFDRRAPGSTCMTELGAGGWGTIQHPRNDSKGCGGVMRVAPIGLYHGDGCRTPAEAAQLAAEAAALTHGHELGYLSAAALAYLIHVVAHDPTVSLSTATQQMFAALPALFPRAGRQMNTLLDLLNKAADLSTIGRPAIDVIHQLGEGWVGEETLAIALYCALKCAEYADHDNHGCFTPDQAFQMMLVASVNHGGDSDSTGAVTGNLMGAYYGQKAIPPVYLAPLELRDTIQEVADALLDDRPLTL